MARTILAFTLLAFIAFGCNSSTDKTNDKVYSVSELLDVAEANIDSTIMIEGEVTHVCKHGGERLFIMDVDSNTMKIETGEKIAKFDETLEGLDIIVEAIVREMRIDTDYLDEWEAELVAEMADTTEIMTEEMTEDVEAAMAEAADVIKEEADELEEVAEEMHEGEHHEELHEGKHEGEHETDFEAEFTKITNLREEIAGIEKGYISKFYLEAVSYKEKIAE